MIRSLKTLQKSTLQAEDGEVGHVEDVLFDEDQLRIRYLVANLDELYEGRRALLPATGLTGSQPSGDSLTLPFQIEQILNSPEFRVGGNVTRQQEAELHDYYGWPYYWGVGTNPDVGAGPSLPSYPLVELATEVERKAAEAAGGADYPALHSFRTASGNRILARDGEMGRLDDLLYDDESWRILYMVVDTGGWLSNRKVLVSPSWIEVVDWGAGEVVVDLKRETILNSPPYDPNTILEPDYETRLHQHYGKQQY